LFEFIENIIITIFQDRKKVECSQTVFCEESHKTNLI